MKHFTLPSLIGLAFLPLLIAFALTGCDQDAKHIQSQKANEAAKSIQFTENAEIENIRNRIELTSKPGSIGYIVLLNQMGQPIAYETVRGKITSGGKRLTRPFDYANGTTFPAPSDEGTWGSSDPYIYYWTTSGAYRQWTGTYLYSDQPIRLSQPTLVVESK
jgi:hypothetical protein